MFRAIMRIMEELERCSPEKVNGFPCRICRHCVDTDMINSGGLVSGTYRGLVHSAARRHSSTITSRKDKTADRLGQS